MVGIEVRRNQRPVWAAVSALLGTGVLLSLVLANTARQSAEASAAASAQRAVQEVLAPALTPSDVAQPVTTRRAQQLGALVTERLLSAGPSDRVRIWRRDGTVVFDTDRANIGSREPDERARITRVTEQGRESVVDHSAFRVFVPLRLEADGPIVGVAEVDRPYEPLWGAASRPWRIGTIVLSALLLVSLGLLALTFRDGSRRPRATTPARPIADPAAAIPPPEGASHRRLGADRALTAPTAHRTEDLRAAEARADRAERLAEEANRRLAEVGSELDRMRAAALSVSDNDASEELEALEELRERVRFVEAERDQLTKRLARSEEVGAELARRAATPTTDPNLEQRAAASEERAVRAEAVRQELERRAIELERSLTDANDARVELQRRLAQAISNANGDGSAERLHRELDWTREELVAARDELASAHAAADDQHQQLEALQRREKLQEALRRLRDDDDTAASTAAVGTVPLEDRRASAPFVEQLSNDARASVAAIQGMLLAMQQRPPGADDASLVDKLRAHAGKLDHLVSDLQHADDIARGDVVLRYEPTDLDALIRRVVDDAPIDHDRHPVTVRSEPVTLAVDPIRAEEIVSALVINAASRATGRAPIVVTLTPADGGALLIVEDDAPSSDASMSPVVARFADVHGGWATVEGRQGGGSAFRVFLPDHIADAAPEGGDDVTIKLPETSPHGLTAP